MNSEILANMSHELRAPLNTVIGFAEVLNDSLLGELNDRQRDCVSEILASGRHLLALINDILDVSKAEVGTMELDPEAVDLKPILSNQFTIVRERAHTRAVTLASDIDCALPTLMVDPRRVKQIVFNLLSNAVKTAPKGGKIELSARHVADHEQPRLIISVSESSTAVAARGQPRPAESVAELDGTQASPTHGTGLELMVAQKLARLHGGDVSISSERGKGSTFTLTIPCVVVADVRPVPVPEAVALDAQAPRPIALVVDDDDSSSELLRMRFESLGLAVLCARTAEDALQLARVSKPALITLDILLRESDGWDLLAQLKSTQETAAIPVVVVSFFGDAQKGSSLGATSVLQKPVDLKALSTTLQSLSLLPAPGTEDASSISGNRAQSLESGRKARAQRLHR